VGSYGGEEGGAVHIRGMGTTRPGSEIKTYIDDVPFYMGVWNHPLLDLLPINGMSRVEVVKGTQPQRYGNNFGAINLVSKQAGPTEGVQGDVQLSAGSFQTVVEQFDLVGRNGDWDYALAQGYAKSEGHREFADGKLSNVMGQLGLRMSKEWSIRWLMLQADNTAGDPGHITTLAGRGDTYATKGQMVSVSLAHQHEQAQGSVKIYSNSTHGTQSPGFDSTFEATGMRWREDWQAWTGGNITYGLDYDTLDGTGVNTGAAVNFSAEQLAITSPYLGVSHTAKLGGGLQVTPSAGVRMYDHSQFGTDTTPHFGVVLEQAGQWALRANVASGVNYPGVDVQILTTIVPVFGGPNLGTSWKTLNPETVDHQELGFSWFATSSTSFDIAVFTDKVKNRYVITVPTFVTAGFANVGDYTVNGSEISIQQKIGAGLSLFAGVTNLSSSKADLPYSPSSAVSLGVNWQGDDWRVSADVQNQSGMTVLKQDRSGTANTDKVDGFTVVNMRVGYKLPSLGKRGEVFLATENLTDQTYYFRTGYPMPGASAQVGLKASF
jgi:iron complex outermembrane receptor protein